ncbi:MAG TPA: YceI family protein [Acidimicrobiales bacterium]|nr:YceI family protein [Acidimicrobiales bacterium]
MTRYAIVPDRSTVWIEARSNVHPIQSTTSGLEGFVELALGPTGSVDLADAPVGRLSLNVERLKSGNRLEDREMQKRVDARRHPRIEGVLDSVVGDGKDGRYRVSGDVTFRGVSRHHEDLMDISKVDDRTIRLAGSSRFDIRDFGMEPPKVLMLKVEPVVDVRVDILAVEDD